MAIKANASSQGSDFKKYVGVGSFRVVGVNPTKEEMESFFGREISKEPVYVEEKVDEKDNNKKYVRATVMFLIQADKCFVDGKANKTNEKLFVNNDNPLKMSVRFYLDSRYMYSAEKDKYQVMDKYGRTAWVTAEQAKNHQIPVYANGPANLDADYHPTYHGEEKLTNFILNYLNVTPIQTYNSNTGKVEINKHPEDCEGNLYHIKDYFKGDFSELKEFISYIPSNCVKLCVGVQTDDQGRQFNTVYSGFSMRNGAKSYTKLQDTINGDSFGASNTVFSNDGHSIKDIEEYIDSVQESDLSKPSAAQDPFASSQSGANELPFGPESNDDPFAGM